MGSGLGVIVSVGNGEDVNVGISVSVAGMGVNVSVWGMPINVLLASADCVAELEGPCPAEESVHEGVIRINRTRIYRIFISALYYALSFALRLPEYVSKSWPHKLCDTV